MCPKGRTRFCVQVDDYSWWNEPLSKACLKLITICYANCGLKLWRKASDTSM